MNKRTTDRPVGLYPGTFDPVTRGHEDLISRALTVVDALIVGVAADTDKRPLFSIDERVAMLTEVLGSDRVFRGTHGRVRPQLWRVDHPARFARGFRFRV